MTVTHCPHCRGSVGIRAADAGKTARCPRCRSTFTVPGDIPVAAPIRIARPALPVKRPAGVPWPAWVIGGSVLAVFLLCGGCILGIALNRPREALRVQSPGPPPQPEPKPNRLSDAEYTRLKAQAEKIVAGPRAKGTMRDRREDNVVRLDVPAAAFGMLDYESKRKTCVAYSLVHSTGPHDLPDVHVYDQDTGKKLGYYVIGTGLIWY